MKNNNVLPFSNKLIFSDEINKKIKECAKNRNIPPEELLNNLLENEIERQRLVSLIDNEENSRIIPVENIKLNKLCLQYLGNIGEDTETFYLATSIELLYNNLIEENLVDVKIDPTKIVESKRLDIDKLAHYYLGGFIAKYVGGWFGTMPIYFNRIFGGYLPELFFIGMPSNVEISCRVFCLLYNHFDQLKLDYQKGLGKKMKKSKREECAGLYIYEQAEQLRDTDAWIGDEEDHGFLYAYVKENYPSTLRDF